MHQKNLKQNDPSLGLLALKPTDLYGFDFNDDANQIQIAGTFIGTPGIDVLNGTTGADMLDGKGGDDFMTGFAGDDTYFVDRIGDQITEASGGGFDTVNTASSYILNTVMFVEKIAAIAGSAAFALQGNQIDNELIGNEIANSIAGGGGDDILVGGDGDDILTGGMGLDRLEGGQGNDYFSVSDTFDMIIEEVNEGADTVGTSINFSLSQIANVENLIITEGFEVTLVQGNALDNRMTGNARNNTIHGLDGSDILDGKAGIDKLYGGKGNDTFYVDDVMDQANENSGEGSDTVFASISYVLQENGVENLTALGNAVFLNGNKLSNVITGNNLANTIDGSFGADTLIGGKGDDVYIVDNAGDFLVEKPGEGIDRVVALASFSLAEMPEIENIQAQTGQVSINLIGNSSANQMTGNQSNNVLDGGLGIDTMTGQLGNDTYVVDNAGDKIVENANQGIDTVVTLISFSLATLANVEHILTAFGVGSVTLTGNALANQLTSGGGNDTLDGGAGNDVLTAGDGDDQLLGGAGADTMDGGLGNDFFGVDSQLDVVIDAVEPEPGGGLSQDTVVASVSYILSETSGVERLFAEQGTSQINLTGNSLDNVIMGNAGANMLIGNDGDDTLAGGDGADTLVGGVGRDRFLFEQGFVDRDVDEIVDFVSGTDVIQLDRTIFKAFASQQKVTSSDFHVGGEATASSQNLVYDTQSGALFYDADGNGSGEAVQFALLRGNLALKESDFVLV